MNDLLGRKLIDAEVIDIKWERINLYIDVKIKCNDGFDKNVPLDFYLVNGKYIAKAKFKAVEVDENVYQLYINITNPGYNRCLPRGMYTIVVCQGDNEIAHCVTSPSIVKKMSDFSRSFLYGGRSKVYSVVFFVDDTDEYALPFTMYTMASSATSTGPQNKMSLSPREKIEQKKKSSFVGKLKTKSSKLFKKYFGKSFEKRIIKLIYKIFTKIYSSSKKTVLFMSEQNKQISSNQKAVYDRMIERGLDKEFDILFSFRSAVAEKQNLKSWIVFLKKISKSTMVILDDHAPVLDWMNLIPKTKVVQIWHAGAGFKSSGYSRWGNTGCPSTYSCHRQYSYGIAGSKNIAHFFSEVWGINTEMVLPTGMPRMDQFLDENYRKETTEKLYEQYPVCKGKKVILFAPTYRGKNKADAHYPYELIDFDKLYDVAGDEYVVLFKMHPWVAQPVPIPEKYMDKFIDVGTYPNINDLFYITNLLITDYSSNIFEYSLMKNPMLFFAFDEIQYSFSRGFHRDYELSAPGKIVHTFDELLDAINNKDFDLEKVEKYVDEHFDYIDSNASDRVIDWIILGNIPKDLKKAIDDKNNEVKRTANLEFTMPEALE